MSFLALAARRARHATIRAGFAVAGGLAVLAGCNAIWGVEDGILDSADATAGDANVGPQDGALAPDVAVGCGAKTDDALGIYVKTDGTDSDSCGSRDAACKSVQKGIDRAVSFGGAKGVVYVASGTYVESVKLSRGILVTGGLQVVGNAWTFACGDGGSSLTTIEAPAGSSKTITAIDLSGGASVKDLTVRSKADAPAPGESIYGVFAVGASTSLTLENVIVAVGKAGDGVKGANGGAGPLGNGNCPPSDGGVGASITTPGNGSDGGAFAASGWQSGMGDVGPDGGVGQAGPAGSPGSCVDCVTCVPGVGCATNFDHKACGDAGGSGCGGGGGLGGGGGGGGGSSVAVFAWDAHVTINGGSYSTDNGGNGAAGGTGGDGGPGGLGTPGKQTSDCTTACTALLPCQSTTTAHGDGGAPSKGGPGGSGGPGGGGAGGSSFAIVQAGNAEVTETNGVAHAHQNFGQGGPPNGANGKSGDRWP